MNDYKLMLLKKDSSINISGVSGNLSWKSSIETLGVELNFDVAFSKDKYFPKFKIELGDKIIFSNGSREIFRGIITDESLNGEFSRNYIAFDFAFYLNKSKTIIQFDDARADEAIRKLCAKVGVPLANVPNMKTKIAGIYKDKTISEIIKEILEENSKEFGTRYFIEMIKDKLSIGEITNEPINFNLNLVGSINLSRSINELRNSITCVSGEEKSVRTIYKANDLDSINKYGLLEDTLIIEKKDISQARHLSKTMLEAKNKTSETMSVDMLGSDIIKSGMTIFLKDDVKNINGNYLVKDCAHTLTAGIHKMNLNVEVIS